MGGGMSVNLDSVREPARRRVWDAPVRVFHALLIACIAGAWLTRAADQLDLHAVFGYGALFLVGFRIAWGFVGSVHARFTSFAFGPREVVAYLGGALRGAPRHYTGHNPAGSVAVFGLLALVAVASLTGVAAIGALYGEGPVPQTSSFELADALLALHEGFAWAVLVLAGLHLLGVAWGSYVHRENLAAAMVTGRKATHDGDAVDAPARRGVAALVVAGVAGIALAYLAIWSPRDVQRRQAEEDSARNLL
jgi:cytochrome b